MHIGLQIFATARNVHATFTFRHSRSFIVLYVTDVQERGRSSCNMTAHCPTLLFCEWRGFRRMSRKAGKFFLLSTPQGGSSPLKPPFFFWVDEGLGMKSAVYDQ